MVTKRALIGFGLTIALSHFAIGLVAWGDVREIEARFGYHPANTRYIAFVERLNRLPVLKQLRAGDWWDLAFSWVNRLSAKDSARRDANRGRFIMLCRNGRASLAGTPSCHVSALRMPDHVVAGRREDEERGLKFGVRYLRDEPGLLDEITCSTDNSSELALQVDLYFGGCVYHPSVHLFFETYNDEMLVQLLGRMTQR